MKSIAILGVALCCLLLGMPLHGQGTDSARIQALGIALQQLQAQFAGLESQLAAAGKQLVVAQTATTAADSARVKANKAIADTKRNADALANLERGRELDLKDRWAIVRNNLIVSAETYGLLASKAEIMLAYTATDQADAVIKDLNNPESNALGFSLNQRVLDLIEEKVANKSSKLYPKIIASAKSIISSPIVRNVSSLTPALGIANAVIGVLHSVSIANKEIDTLKIRQFETELNKYIVFYAALDSANKRYTYAVAHSRDELQLLQGKINGHLMFSARAVQAGLVQTPGISLTVPEPKTFDVAAFLRTYRRSWMENYITALENSYRRGTEIAYADLLREQPRLKEASNNMEELVFLCKQLDYLCSEYFNATELYYRRVGECLALAEQQRITAPAKVAEQRARLTTAGTTSISQKQRALNLPELSDNVEQLKYRYRVF